MAGRSGNYAQPRSADPVSDPGRATGALAALPCLALFVLASCADPGTITKDGLAGCLARYPHDGVLYVRRACATCSMIKPARSKHCPICNRRAGRGGVVGEVPGGLGMRWHTWE